MKFPCYLSKGDYIAITAPSDGNHDSIDYLRLERAKSILQSKGYFSIETENVRTSEKGRSSSAKSRGKQFMKAWMNPDVKAVFSAKGGDFLDRKSVV